ncbi:MAG: type II toxin-antitoxin system prevent-host-death family antitoxin [Lachnospiraceae bacterium]|nr:type II toxin-antitoxin system prevent-host-death family antitoxin [Lachnospiraceae bacterium]
MIATKQMDIRANIKKYFDIAYNGEPVIVSRKQNKNVVVISEAEYNNLQKAKRNAEYLAHLDRSFDQLEQGEVVVKSIEELEAMADE